MGNELARFLGSLTAASWLRFAMTMALTTASVYAAFPENRSLRLILGCNLMTLCGALLMEYKNFKARR